MHSCVADNILVKPLHTSDHYFIIFNLPVCRQPLYQLPLDETSVPFTLTFLLCSVLLSSLAYPFLISGCSCSNWHFMLHFNFLSTRYMSSISSRPARVAPSNPWLSDVFHECWSNLRAAERKWHKSKDPSDRSMYQSLFSSFFAEVHTAKQRFWHM